MASESQLDRFLKFLQSTEKSPHTIHSYESDLKQFAKWFESVNKDDMRLTRITPTDLRQFKRYMIEDAGLKPQTINRRLQAIKTFLEWGWSSGKIKHRFPMPKKVKQMTPTPKWLDRNQQNHMFRHIERYGKTRDKAIIRLLINTGLRVGELAALRWCDVFVSERKGYLRVVSGKGEKYREVPLNKDAREALMSLDYYNHAGSEVLIFEGQRGNLSSRGIQLVLERLLQYSEVGKVSPHQLRHTFCKNLVDAGVSLEKIAALAGHESLDTTRLYCQPSFDDLSDAVEKIGELE